MYKIWIEIPPKFALTTVTYLSSRLGKIIIVIDKIVIVIVIENFQKSIIVIVTAIENFFCLFSLPI